MIQVHLSVPLFPAGFSPPAGFSSPPGFRSGHPFISDPFSDSGPCIGQPFHGPGCVSRAGRRQTDTVSLSHRLCIFLIHFLCGTTIYIDIADLSGLKNRSQIIWRHILNAGVGGSPDPARGDHIPGRNMIAQQKSFPLGNTHRYRFPEDCSDDLPEPVLRVSVEEHRFPGLDRRETAKDQDPG